MKELLGFHNYNNYNHKKKKRKKEKEKKPTYYVCFHVAVFK